jgi:hypothetical protein
MVITFTKGGGRVDRMDVERGGGVESIECPKQGIIPHDMFHYAVESTLHKRGFLRRVAAGEVAESRMAPDPESDGVERLVEVFQGDGWSGGTTPPGEMLDLYGVTCAARDCPPLAVTVDDILAIRARIADLDRQWRAVAVGGSLRLRFDDAS